MKIIYHYDPSTKLYTEDEVIYPDANADPSAPKTYTYTNALEVQPIGLHTPKLNAAGDGWVEGQSAADKLAALKAAKLAEIEQAFDTAMAGLVAGFPQLERESWSKQEAEARAYTADNTVTTPMLTALAQARGITVAILASAVIAKADRFAGASGALIGKRQAAEDALASATTQAAIKAVTF